MNRDLSANDDTNEEFMTAAANIPKEDSRPVHWAVCDGCNSFIFGLRYRCVDCDDFDFCDTCWTKSRHPPNHIFFIMFHPIRPKERNAFLPSIKHAVHHVEQEKSSNDNLFCHSCRLDKNQKVIAVASCLTCSSTDNQQRAPLCNGCIATHVATSLSLHGVPHIGLFIGSQKMSCLETLPQIQIVLPERCFVPPTERQIQAASMPSNKISSDQLRLRLSHLVDLAEVAAIEYGSFEDVIDQESLAELVANNCSGASCYVIELLGTVVGYATVAISPVTGVADITSFAISGMMRERGIGKEMMAKLLDVLCHQKRVSTVELHVDVVNIAAQRLYMSFGFEQIAYVPNYYWTCGHDGIKMRFVA